MNPGTHSDTPEQPPRHAQAQRGTARAPRNTTPNPSPNPILGAILAGFLLLGTVYSIVTPLFEASDELWHYPMVKYVADHNFGLPVQDPSLGDDAAPWRQEGGQPPLYYFIGAAATMWIDTDDMREVRRLNPHANIGEVVPDGNANMVVHRTEREAFPWSGTVLAMRIVRFLSLIMGAGTVVCAYLLGRDLFPATPAVALTAAALTAFNPMFVFVSSVINNDNLSTLLASVLLVMVVRLVQRPDTPPPRYYVLLGVTAGAGMLAKFQIGFMLPLIALALGVVALRARSWRPLIIGGAISGGLTILIAGWWYWRNYDLYGDATGINVFLDIVGRRAVPADLHQLWTEREVFWMSYWGLFGGVNVPLSDFAYDIFNSIAAIAAAGLLVGVTRPLVGALTGAAGERFRAGTAPEARAITLARLFAAVWPVIVFLSLMSWTRQTWATQGRLWFSAIAALSLSMAVGLANWAHLARRLAHVFGYPHLRAARLPFQIAALGVPVTVFVVAAVLVPFTTIRPAYTLDRDATWDNALLSGDGVDTVIHPGGAVLACLRAPEADPQHEALCLASGARLDSAADTLRPGEFLRLEPLLTVKNEITRDWSIFVHLIGEDGIIEAQRDVYPGGGLLATSDLEPGETWRNLIAVEIPPGIYAPQTLDVYLGFYHLPTGARMIPGGLDADASPEQRRVYLGQVTLEPPPGDVPNPVDVNFGNRLRLRGYTISDRALAPGDETTVTLYWEARQDLATDYVVSVQILNPDAPGLPKAGQLDRPPDPPTITWERGQRVTDPCTVTIFPDAGPGRYRVIVRVYPAGDVSRPLRVIGDTGAQSEDFVWLAWMQITPGHIAPGDR